MTLHRCGNLRLSRLVTLESTRGLLAAVMMQMDESPAPLDFEFPLRAYARLSGQVFPEYEPNSSPVSIRVS